MRNRNTHVQHTRTVRCCFWKGMRSRESVERLVVVGGRPLPHHGQAHPLGILPSTEVFFLRRLFGVADSFSLIMALHDTLELA